MRDTANTLMRSAFPCLTALLACAIMSSSGTRAQPAHESRPAASAAPAPASAPGAPPGQPARPDGGTVSPFAILSQARHYLSLRRPHDAVPLLRRFVALRPGDATGHFWLGVALDDAGDPRSAIWSYSKSLELGSRHGMDSAELRVNIGNTLMKLDRLDDAVFNYRRAIEIDPGLALAHFNLGRALLAKHQAEDCFHALNKSRELGLGDPALFFYRGLALAAMGKQDDAREQLDLFLKGAPETAETMPARRKAEELIGSGGAR